MDGLGFTGLLFDLPQWALALGGVLGLFCVALFSIMRRFSAGKRLPLGAGRLQR